MKVFLNLIVIFIIGIKTTTAQFGFVEKDEIEKFKDTRLVVVLFADSAYNASIKKAVETYWTFNTGFVYVYDTAIKSYNKPEFSFLTFSKSKKSKNIKAKLGSSEDDFNGLLITNKFKKRSKVDEIIANAYCSNNIDTNDWYPELIRGVQMLNNFFNYAVVAKDDDEISASYMMDNYPSDISHIKNKKLLVEEKMLMMKGKEDASIIYGNEVEEVEREEIYKAIISQNSDIVYVYSVSNEIFCDKIYISAANSKVVHFSSSRVEKCKCEAKDLKALRLRIEKITKSK
jgi:hypothetical protein